MDSITQIVLGAAVGEAIAGRKVGYRAALWGACLGTMPDLDILAAPLLDEAAQLRFHRGFTHSFLFSILSSPLIGWGLHKLDRKSTRLNSSHVAISYAVFCLTKTNQHN